MEQTYSPKSFSKLVGVSVLTLQLWNRKGTLTAHRTPTNRRYYTTAIITVFSARLPGLRPHKNAIRAAARLQDDKR